MASNTKDFLELFAASAGISIETVVEQLGVAGLGSILLVGSIPLGTATSASDIDLLIVQKDDVPVVPVRQGAITVSDCRDAFIELETIQVVNGIEINVQVVSEQRIALICESLSRRRVDLELKEIAVLSRLRSGWLLLGPSYDLPLAIREGLLDIYCCTRDFAIALNMLEDATAALDDSHVLSLHLGRMAVEKCVTSYFASRHTGYLGTKWLRFLSSFVPAEPERGDFSALKESIPTLLFPELRASTSASAYIEKVSNFVTQCRRLIERDETFRIALASAPLVYELTRGRQ